MLKKYHDNEIDMLLSRVFMYKSPCVCFGMNPNGNDISTIKVPLALWYPPVSMNIMMTLFFSNLIKWDEEWMCRIRQSREWFISRSHFHFFQTIHGRPTETLFGQIWHKVQFYLRGCNTTKDSVEWIDTILRCFWWKRHSLFLLICFGFLVDNHIESGR